MKAYRTVNHLVAFESCLSIFLSNERSKHYDGLQRFYKEGHRKQELMLKIVNLLLS